LSAHWHKPGGFNYAMGGHEGTCTSMSVAAFAVALKGKITTVH
jgi:hypothetical protein